MAPIFGSTQEPHSPFDFSAYAQMARKAAKDSNVPIAVLTEEIASLAPEEPFSHIADDDWHPNTHGHAVYAEEIMKLLLHLGWFSEHSDRK